MILPVYIMRKNELRRFANNQLNNDNHGSHRTRQFRRFVIQRVIDDLFKLKQCPAKWHAVTQDHILALVSRWKKQKIKPATMMKYMTVIRYFLQSIDHPIDGIDNQTLKIARIKPKVKNTLALTKPTHPIARIIFDLQTEFGLTFGEAIRINPDIHLREHSIWLTREITFNSQDRVIPLHNDEQLIILQSLRELTNHHHNLISAHGYHAVRHAYRASMQEAGLSPTKSCRYLYARQQFSGLSQAFSHRDATLLIMREMGLSKLHGLRHAYAQRRYRELTTEFDRNKMGLISPIEGGKCHKALTAHEKMLDRKARQIISRELGHSRINITRIYLS